MSKSIAVYYFNYLATQVINLHIPMVITPEKAKNISEIYLKEQWYGQFIYDFELPPAYISVKVNDIIELNINSKENILIKVTNNSIKAKKVNQIQAVTVSKDIYNIKERYSPKQESILFCNNHFDPGYAELVCLITTKITL